MCLCVCVGAPKFAWDTVVERILIHRTRVNISFSTEHDGKPQFFFPVWLDMVTSSVHMSKSSNSLIFILVTSSVRMFKFPNLH